MLKDDNVMASDQIAIPSSWDMLFCFMSCLFVLWKGMELGA